MVLPTLNAHATRPKILLKFCKISLDQSILHGKEQEEGSVLSQFFAALCNVIAARRLYTSNLRNYHWICPICMAGQQEELCFSLVLHSTSQWNCAEALLNAELCYSQEIIKPSLCHLQSSAHSNRARYQTQKSANFHSISPICMQKEAVSCATFLQHFAMHTRNGEQ